MRPASSPPRQPERAALALDPLARGPGPTSPSAASAARVWRRRVDPFATKEYMQLEFGEPADDGCARPGLWLDTFGLACGRAVPCGAWSAECGVRRAPGPLPSCSGVYSPARTRASWRGRPAVHELQPKSQTPMPYP